MTLGGSDGSCRAVLEAMAMGLPILATPRGMLPETVRDPDAGAIVPEEEGAFADALVDFARDPEGWRARGRAARELVCGRNDVRRLAANLEAFYEGLARLDRCEPAPVHSRANQLR